MDEKIDRLTSSEIDRHTQINRERAETVAILNMQHTSQNLSNYVMKQPAKRLANRCWIGNDVITHLRPWLADRCWIGNDVIPHLGPWLADENWILNDVNSFKIWLWGRMRVSLFVCHFAGFKSEQLCFLFSFFVYYYHYYCLVMFFFLITSLVGGLKFFFFPIRFCIQRFKVSIFQEVN